MRRTVLSLALVLLAASALAACGDSDDDVDVTGEAQTSSPDDSTGTTTDSGDTTSTTGGGPTPGTVVVWEPSTPSGVATDVAVAFAAEYLGIAGAQTADDDADAGCAADVPVTKGPSGATTTVSLAQGDEGCVVIGATTESIVVDQPGAGAEITSPVSVSGQAQAFEGTVVVEVRPALGTQALGEGFVTGQSDALAPFSGTVDFVSGTEAGGEAAVVFFAPDESGEGTAISATVVGVHLG
jgi:hypothetical protein